MKNIEKIHELLDMALCVQMHGRGENNHPYVKFETSNYGNNIEITIKDGGFDSSRYDGEYRLSFSDLDCRTYRNCKEHLQDLINLIEWEEA